MDIYSRAVSSDGKAIKYTQQTEDGFLVESTYVDHGGKHIICFSSQIGCVIGCRFCASGQPRDRKRFRQSLSAREMVGECVNVVLDRLLFLDGRLILFSCMGEGEPLLNLEAVIDSFRQLAQLYPHSRIALSTSGVFPERIAVLADAQFLVPMKLQILLYAPSDDLRHALIPVGAPLTEIVLAANAYAKKTRTTVEWNYVLLQGVNDQPVHARALVRLLPSGAHVKLNRFNATPWSSFVASSAEASACFKAVLQEHGLIMEVYETNGSDINAACG
jgi:23S rRNA (adenine2503-C2)-methyltransferase